MRRDPRTGRIPRTALIALALVTTLPLSCTSVRTAPVVSSEPISLDRVPIEYAFGRRITETFAMSPDDWAHVKAAFSPPARSAAEERGQIREAVARMEQRAGRTTPARQDLGRNATVPETMGQMDCVNESTNTTTFLRLFQQEKLMRRHAVLGRAHRSRVLFDAHYAAQILDVATGERYVVDSWFLANGLPPMIQRVDAWGRKEPMTAASLGAATADAAR